MEDEVIGSTVEEVAQPEIVETETPKSMDDTIRETLEAIQSRESEDEDRIRDEKGRFARKDDPPQEPAPEAKAAKADDHVVAEASAPAVPLELQKLGLRKDEAEAIASNPVALQAFMRRSEEMHKGLEQYREKAQVGDELLKAAEPFAQILQSYNTTPAQAFSRLMYAEMSLRNGTPEQKTQMLLKIAGDYGIDLGQAMEYRANQPQVDPQVQALQAQLGQMQSWIQQQSQQREQQERESLNSQIQTFANDPSNVYFGEVKSEMAALLQAGLATDLKDAYDKAVYANPVTRAKLQAEQLAKTEEARKQEASQKAQVAKRAAVLNLPKRGVLQPAKPVGSMEDTIRETAQRLGIM